MNSKYMYNFTSQGRDVQEGKLSNHIGLYDNCDYYWYQDINEIADFWTEIEANSNSCPFRQFEWINSIIDAKKQDVDYEQNNHIFVVGFRNNKPILILPFARASGFLGDSLTWLGHKISDYNGMIVNREYAAVMPQDLLTKVLDMIHLTFPTIHAAHLIRNAETDLVGTQFNDARSQTLSAEFSSHALALHQNWDKLFAATRSSKSRQRLRSKLRALKRVGKVTFGQVRGLNENLAAAKQIIDWKSDQLDKSGKRNPFYTDNQPTTTCLTIPKAIASKNSRLHVFGLFLDGEMIAGMLAFVTKENYYYYVASFSEDVGKNYSIGTLLLVKTMEFASRSGLEYYDFMNGDEAYKDEWCDTRIPLVHFTREFTFRGKLICAMIGLRLSIKKYIIRHPKLRTLLQNNLKKCRNLINKNVSKKQPAIGLKSTLDIHNQKLNSNHLRGRS